MKNKKIIFGVSIMCVIVIVISITLILITNKSSSRILDSNLENTTDNLDNKAPGMFAIMLETERGSGQYQQSTSGLWPGSGYEFNSTLSQCENGGILTWNEENRTVNLKSNLSDRCYLYFDIVLPPDVTIYTNNNGNYNPSTPATLSCTGATAEYNQKYQRVEISSIANKYTSCNLTYQTPSSKNYLNNYITNLSGTTQGDGRFVDESNATIPIYTNSTAIAQSNYRNVTMYSATSSTATSGTVNTNSFVFSGNNWNSVPDNMTSNTDYHINFNLSKSGYYQACYTLASDSTFNFLYIYKNGSIMYTQSRPQGIIGECIDLGYVNTNDNVKIVQRVDYNSKPTLTFNLQKATSTSSMDTGYRYEGKNPNNYIWFNNELWRIIGVFGEESHGQSGQNLVKIIRTNSIGGISWNKNGVNDWSIASLNQLLNEVYLNGENGTDGEYCYGYDNIPAGNCDYTETGIKDFYRPMIKNVIWYLGGYGGYGATTEEFYGFERGTKVYSENPTSANGYIGLMYISDFGYSVLSSSCTRTTNLSSYNSAACAGQSWLYGQGSEWTITPYLTNNLTFHVYHGGNLNYISNPNTGYAVRPVVYLDSKVYIINGTGSISDPYIIGM